MANIGTNLGNAISDITRWLRAAIKRVNELIQVGDTQNAALLLADIQTVVTAYLTVIKGFLPEHPVTPIPGNFWKKLAWLANNTAQVQLLVTLLSGINPFEEAKAQALAVATKWGFTSEA